MPIQDNEIPEQYSRAYGTYLSLVLGSARKTKLSRGKIGRYRTCEGRIIETKVAHKSNFQNMENTKFLDILIRVLTFSRKKYGSVKLDFFGP
jgi:hypothetical protein